MVCPYCNKPGTKIKWWKTQRAKWTVYRCDSPECKFTYQSAFDGKKEAGPTWAAREKIG